MITQKQYTLEMLNEGGPMTLPKHLGIEITEVGDDYLVGRMPVEPRTHQPMGILHGGASVVLAETLGSVGSFLCLDSSKFYAVGLEINANHVRSVRNGYVYGRASLVHLGKTTHIWDIRITSEDGKLVNISRLTMAILPIA
ncbi:MAG: hotdog fold thioesterase [Cytophagales bacterium]|nr:MAG: hotdog fold thioesterase [Cytophagales bacterium]